MFEAGYAKRRLRLGNASRAGQMLFSTVFPSDSLWLFLFVTTPYRNYSHVILEMSKRRFNPSLEEDNTPIVEKLYKYAFQPLLFLMSDFRQSQPNFHAAGGFMADDDEQEEIREQIAEAKQKSWQHFYFLRFFGQGLMLLLD